MLLAPECSFDGGGFRNFEIVTRPGSLHDARESAACAWYYSSFGLLIDLFISTLGEVLPGRATAAQFGDSMVTCFVGHDRRDPGGTYMCVEAHAGGWGGVINVLNGSFRNTPVEALEERYPVTDYVRPAAAPAALAGSGIASTRRRRSISGSTGP